MTTCAPGQRVIDYALTTVGAGTVDRECAPCAFGTYSDFANAPSCRTCPGGTKANDQRTGCEEEDEEDGLPLMIILALAVGVPAVIILAGVIVYATRAQRAVAKNKQVGELIKGVAF